MSDDWHGILDPGETILWQGRPDGGASIDTRMLKRLPASLFVIGFAVYWMVGAAESGGNVWMAGLFMIAAGLSGIVWPPLRALLVRRGSFYTLTDRRAFIATQLPLKGKSLQSYPIDGDTLLRLAEGQFTSIHFAEETRRKGKRRETVPIGFERLPEGREVYALMRQVQRGEVMA